MKLTHEDLTKLEHLFDTYLRLSELLTYEEVVLDKKLCYKYEKDRDALFPVIEKYEKYLQLTELINEFKNEPNLEKELDELNIKLESASSELKTALLNFNAEVQEMTIEVVKNKNSDLLLNDIVIGYTNFAQNHNFDINKSQEKNTTFLTISGNNAKNIFKNEVGIHLSSNESCNVFVYESYVAEEISFNDSDIEISVTRSSGAGGQHINTSDSAIKVTHLKTGITASCQSERSQLQNRDKALAVLKERVITHYSNLKNDYISKAKKEQIKLIKNNHIIKHYDYELQTITKSSKEVINLKNFLLGKEI